MDDAAFLRRKAQTLRQAEEDLEQALHRFIALAEERPELEHVNSLVKRFARTLEVQFPREHGGPPGFRVIDVPGDGNCLYWAIGKANDPRSKWTEESVAKFKRKLLEQANKLSETDLDLMPGVVERLGTPGAWGEEHEIQLAADRGRLCIYVFKQLWRRPHLWTVHLFVPASAVQHIVDSGFELCLYQTQLVYDATKYNAKPPYPKAIAVQDLQPCPQCSEMKTIYLLNQVVDRKADGHHYLALIPKTEGGEHGIRSSMSPPAAPAHHSKPRSRSPKPADLSRPHSRSPEPVRPSKPHSS